MPAGIKISQDLMNMVNDLSPKTSESSCFASQRLPKGRKAEAFDLLPLIFLA